MLACAHQIYLRRSCKVPDTKYFAASFTMLSVQLRRAALQQCQQSHISPVALFRALSTLPNNPHIYVVPDPKDPSSQLLTLLQTEPPTPSLALGTTSKVPPTSDSLKQNPKFSQILHSVIAEHAHNDPNVQQQAAALASSGGFNLGKQSSSQFGGSSSQGGAGGGNRGGFVHVSDERHMPDFGRIAEPEDIFGSLEVDGAGKFVDGHGNYQESGTYRMVTNEGVFGLGVYLREKLVERLKLEEANIKNQK
jgi:hypothetical protein